MVPDLSSTLPRPQMRSVEASYSPPNGSCVQRPRVALSTGTTSGSDRQYAELSGGAKGGKRTLVAG